MRLSSEFVEWFLALAASNFNLSSYRLADVVTFPMYTQLVYWDLYFQANDVSVVGQKDFAQTLLRFRLLNGIVSLAYPVEHVVEYVRGGDYSLIRWDNGKTSRFIEPTADDMSLWLGEAEVQ